MKRLNSKGFTLIELMVVIVIIGILAALAIPKFLGATAKAKATECKPVLKQMYTLEEAYAQEKNTYTTDKAQIGFDDPQASTRRFDYAVGTGTATDFEATATVNGTGKIKIGATDLNGQIGRMSEKGQIWSTNADLRGLLSALSAEPTS
jgi:type IV pilus assembly protein PilA